MILVSARDCLGSGDLPVDAYGAGGVSHRKSLRAGADAGKEMD